MLHNLSDQSHIMEKAKVAGWSWFFKAIYRFQFSSHEPSTSEKKKTLQKKKKETRIQINLCTKCLRMAKCVENFGDLSGMKRGVTVPWKVKMKTESTHPTLCWALANKGSLITGVIGAVSYAVMNYLKFSLLLSLTEGKHQKNILILPNIFGLEFGKSEFLHWSNFVPNMLSSLQMVNYSPLEGTELNSGQTIKLDVLWIHSSLY